MGELCFRRLEENEERRRRGTGGMEEARGEHVLFKRTQSQKPAELAKALETALWNNVVSVRFILPLLAFFYFVRCSFESMLRYKRYKPVSLLPPSLSLSFSFEARMKVLRDKRSRAKRSGKHSLREK